MLGRKASLIDKTIAFKLEAQMSYLEGNYCTFLTTLKIEFQLIIEESESSFSKARYKLLKMMRIDAS